MLPLSGFNRIASASPHVLSPHSPHSTTKPSPRTHRRRTGACHCVPTATAKVASAEPPQLQLSEPAWAQALSDLTSALPELPEDQAKLTLEKAFGWKGQAYWRGSKVCQVPELGDVGAVLQYLTSLGLQGEQLAKVVRLFPEVLACSVEGQLQKSVAKLQGEWRMTGDVLTRALVRQPQVLGFDRDCEGTCFGECNRCWARF
ncbi:hypothetical protein QJQ45_028660 [Haematococcus lacustris]|nr:hypothetical protein QJQ45_028660 [Haematococcus lacustris]